MSTSANLADGNLACQCGAVEQALDSGWLALQLLKIDCRQIQAQRDRTDQQDQQAGIADWIERENASICRITALCSGAFFW